MGFDWRRMLGYVECGTGGARIAFVRWFAGTLL